MKRLTVSVPSDFKAKLDAHPTIDWPAVMRQGILDKLTELKK